MDLFTRPLMQHSTDNFAFVFSRGAVYGLKNRIGLDGDLGSKVNQWQAHLDGLLSSQAGQGLQAISPSKPRLTCLLKHRVFCRQYGAVGAAGLDVRGVLLAWAVGVHWVAHKGCAPTAVIGLLYHQQTAHEMGAQNMFELTSAITFAKTAMTKA